MVIPAGNWLEATSGEMPTGAGGVQVIEQLTLWQLVAAWADAEDINVAAAHRAASSFERALPIIMGTSATGAGQRYQTRFGLRQAPASFSCVA
ncbi:MAG: hypothetical protein KDI75_02570 [Xanthomonadales bacterium]|nr:hypothetical protein [Xanthomonadales bacterium]